jgi:GntR family transcriptional regulator
MLVELDFRSHIPIYLQIMERIENQVANGALKPSDQLPTVRQLAADLRVNFNTVARAYRLLDEAGVISTQQGRGTYVLERLPAEKARELRNVTLDGLVRAFLADATRNGFGPEEVAKTTRALLARWRTEGAPPADGEEENETGRPSNPKESETW